MARRSRKKSDLLPGTLDLLVLRTLSLRPMHGYGIARHLRQVSGDVLQVEEGSLYPALQRLARRRWTRPAWRRTPTGRRARYYTLTPLGRRQLVKLRTGFEHLIGAIRAVLDRRR